MPMRFWLVAVLTPVLASGCTSLRLSRNTIGQASTLSDLQIQQVMDNLAMFAGNPSAIPFHASITTGSAQVADSGSAAFAMAFGRSQGHLATYSPSFNAQRTIVDSWAMAPVTNDTELRLLSLAYRRAFGFAATLDDDDFANDLAHELKKQVSISDDLRAFNDVLLERQRMSLKRFDNPRNPLGLYDRLDEVTIASNDERIVVTNERVTADKFDPARANPVSMTDPEQTVDARATAVTREVRRLLKDTEGDLKDIPSGWFGIGRRKKDVPRDACYVGHHRDRCGEHYVWVCPEQREQLKKFTLTILSLSTLLEERQVVATAGGPNPTAPASAYIPLAPAPAR
jgi:hypothetical protein